MEKKLSFYVLPFVLIGLATCVELSIEPIQNPLVKKINEGMMLTCSVQGLTAGETADLEWIDANGDPVGDTSTDRIKVRKSGKNTLYLIVRKLMDGDEGEYSCKATVNGNPVEKKMMIELYKGITVNDSPRLQRPNVYTEKAFIECDADAKPIPKVEWSYGDNYIDFTTGDGRYVQEKKGLIIKNITEQDNGIYFCNINVPSMGDYMAYNITIKVTLPPKSSRPATFGKAVVGEPFTMSCYATGDPPPKFTFYKDDILLEGPKFKVDKDNGRLDVEKMEATDSGDYKCIASNVAEGVRNSKVGGMIEEIVNVDVLIPPRIVSVSDISKPEKQPGELVCISEGNPSPDLTWRKFGSDDAFTADQSGNTQLPTLESLVEELPSGSQRSTLKLVFTELKPIDSGTYTCSSTNLAGSASENGTVRVEFKPNFDNTPYTETFGWANHRTKVQCVANGEPRASIKWSRFGETINPNTTYQIENKGQGDVITSDLLVNILNDNEAWIYGDYECLATNQHGDTPIVINLRKASVPQSPIFKTDKITPTSIEILISPPGEDGNQPVLDYKIEYNLQGSTDIQTAFATKPPSHSGEERTKARITELAANSVYKISVRARNNVGLGQPQTMSETTPKVRKPDPVSFKSSPEGANPDFYIVQWQKPLTGGKPITGYKINYNRVEVEGDTSASWTVTKIIDTPIKETIQDDITSHRLTRLVSNTFYQVEVIAINSLGDSEARTMIFKTSTGDGREQPVTGAPLNEETIIPTPKPKTDVTGEEYILEKEVRASPVKDVSPAHIASISSICTALFVCLACLVW